MKEMPHSKQIEVNGVVLDYYEQGNGTTVLLLHGNNQSSKMFSTMFRILAKSNYHVVAVDSRGHGNSTSGTIPFSIHQFANDIIAFCEKKGIDSANVVGYSDGGNIGLTVCKLNPVLISKAVIISGNYRAKGIKLWFLITMRILSCVLVPFAKLSKLIRLQLWKLHLMTHDIGLSETDLNRMPQEVLILAAENDLIYDVHTHALHENIPKSILTVIKNSNHFTILNKEQMLAEIVNFL